MSALMNNYLYGKAGKADFTPDQLPANRMALFLEMFRIRLGGLCGVNLFCLLTSLPAIIWSILTYQVILMDIETNPEAASAMLSGRIITYLLFMIPCLVLTSVLNTGVAYIMRNWSRDQHTFTVSDYKDALKENWKGGLLVGLINGFSLLITYICYTYYGVMASQSGMFWYIPQMLVVILCCVWWMANMLIMPMMVTYEMNFKTLVRNSIIMVVGRLPWSLLFWGLSVLIPLVCLLYVPYGIVIVGIFYAVIGFSLTYFVYASYANSCFDRFLNPRIEGAPVNMGLRDPNLAEEEVEVTEEDIKNL
ncbi:MAG: DUF624 domain-containing protein [Clostridia bacterium]|nr:DUF624 domain-containing protein [Clostridia bacterium]